MTIYNSHLTWEPGNEPKEMPRCIGLVIHHTVTVAPIEAIHRSHLGAPARARGLDGRGFAYSWAIDPQGRIWQGRGTLIGSHTHGNNSSREGIAFIGNFSTHKLPFHMLQAGAQLLAWRLQVHGLLIDKIDLHSKFSQTECPGTRFPTETLCEIVGDILARKLPVHMEMMTPHPFEINPTIDLDKPPDLKT